MSNRNDLNARRRLFAVEQNKRKLPEQESSSRMRAGRPALRSLGNLREGSFNFDIEFESGFRAARKIPVKRGIVFGRGFLME